jgi:pantoate--beta-alanine ligase
MYPFESRLKFNFGALETVMEGKFRPGHFNGVAVVVSKLFHIVKPDVVYFGQKDFQQCAVIKTLIQDLSFDIEMVTATTVRETSGLALSSRNMRLSAMGKQEASHIFKTLCIGKECITQHFSIAKVKNEMQTYLTTNSNIEIEYLEIVDAQTLQNIETPHNRASVICFAGFLEGVRLIDNIIIEHTHA